MIKLLCSTPFETVELAAGNPYRPPVPVYTIRYEGDEDLQIVINGIAYQAVPGWSSGESGETDITVFGRDNFTASFSVKPTIGIIPLKTGLPYEKFYERYRAVAGDPLQAVLDREIPVYALPQPEMKDFKKILDMIEKAYPHFKAICAKPRSHLKSINEIRPIETVKRIGHESIPYLAAHSEDWLARTASGLKPSRLYSRVEVDDFQIYENRVIKTMIDDAVTYLRRKRREVNALQEQLDQIIDINTVNMDSFGFDTSHQICVAKIMGKATDYDGFSNETKQREVAEEQLITIKKLQRQFEELKKSRLYRSNFKSRRVTGSLLKTNILMMDKHYHQACTLWKPLREALIREDTELREWVGDGHLTSSEAEKAYYSYCDVMCRFALNSLQFRQSFPNVFDRKDVCVMIENTGPGFVLEITDNTVHSLATDDEIVWPKDAGDAWGPFVYDGKKITWRQKLDPKVIQDFSDLHRHKKSTGADKKIEVQSKKALFDRLTDINKRITHDVYRILLLPSFCELTDTNEILYKTQTIKGMEKLCREVNAEKGFVLMPLYEKNQWDITEYAFYENEKTGFLSVSVFDINSYRRLRNILLRYIIRITDKYCPCCGEKTVNSGYGLFCRNCGNVYVRKTRCSECGREYSYIWQEISEKGIRELAALTEEDNHARYDSRFQYKNTVPTEVRDDRLEALCPWHREEK